MSEDRLRLSRRRQLTPAAQKMYTDFVIKHTDFLKRLQDRLETLNTQVSSYEGDPVQLQGQIETAFHDYERASSEFFNFLTSQRTEESDREKLAHTITFDSVKVKVKELLSELRKRVSPVKPKSSRPSSVKSRATSTSSVGSQQRARLKLEKAKLRQKYIDEECELAKRRTEIESDEKKLETKRDVEEAEIEVSILDEPSDGRSESQVDSKLTQQRVESFVHEQNEYQQVEQQTQAFSVWTEAEQASQIPPTTYEPMFSSWSPFPAASNPWPMPTMVSQHTYGVPVHTSNNFNPGFPSNSDTLPSNLYTSTHTVGSQIPTPGVTLVSVPQIAPVYSQQTITSTSVCSSPTTPSMLYTSVQSSVPHNVSTVNSVFMSPIASTQAQNSFNISGSPQLTTQSVPVPQRVELLACQEMSKFLMKKDLLKSRLTKFDDRPEFFESWKRTFKDVVRGSELSSLEEIELAQIWLGPQSTTYAKNIQSATLDPKVACKKLWERLEERYGRPEVIEAAVKRKLSQFPKLTNKDYSKLYDLTDIVAEIQSIKSNPRLALQFSYFDSSSGVNQIVQKLPYSIQEKWTTHADKYKCANDCSYPPFDIFANFLHNIARLKNDPSFMYEVNTTQSSKTFTSKNVSTSRSTVVKVEKTDISPTCPVHGTNHSLNMCRSFRKKSINERKDFIKKNNICFKCCGPEKHFAKDCNRTISCVLCKSSKHPTALHIDKSQETFSKSLPSKPVNRMDSDHTSEETTVRCSPVDSDNNNRVSSSCISVCGNPLSTSKSCAKIVLVKVHHKDNPQNALKLYAVLDEQSNRTLAKSKLFDYFDIPGPELPYSLKSCSGEFQHYGRRTSGFVVESLDFNYRLNLPDIIECNYIPDSRDEIPSPECASMYGHLQDIAKEIPQIDPDVDILLLIGRDILPAHHILDQRLGNGNEPYAQKLRLGWVVVGETCLGSQHQTDSISAYRTFTLMDARPSCIPPCENKIHLKELNDVFAKTELDDTPALSVEDRKFLNLMESSASKDNEGCWSMPLPFRDGRTPLPNNKEQALKRAHVFATSLRKNEKKREDVTKFMEKLFNNQHAEEAPPLTQSDECWYLPLFAVYNSKKPGKVRCVFDSSAKFRNTSLNDVLLSGPDLLNSLLGILLRFRQRSVAVSADIEQMFYRFTVPPQHRNFLRFLWHRDNDVNKELAEFRMTRHVFGNKPSPSIATFGLRKCVENAESEVKNFVEKDFYVDDGLASVDTAKEAVELLSKTQSVLETEGKIRLHKIASNDQTVLHAFHKDDLAEGVKTFDLERNETPLQRTLGVIWDVETDSFTFKVSRDIQPFTKRGVLSTINSLYDPIGFLAPVIVRGKIIMRDIMCAGLDWDDPLPSEYYSQWCDWRESLTALERVSAPRVYADLPSKSALRRELHVFSDASQKAIGAVVYLKTYDMNGTQHLSFVLGKAKVAPTHGHTIPRLELCAAVLATQLKDTVVRHLDFYLDSISMYTDSKIVLGYIYNEQRRFHVYVGNRVDFIRQSTEPTYWKYVASEINPADIASRTIGADSIQESPWLHGPSFLIQDNLDFEIPNTYPLVDPTSDKEVRPSVVSQQTTCEPRTMTSLSDRFERYSEWSSLTKAISTLQHVVRSYNGSEQCTGWHKCNSSTDADSQRKAELFIFKTVQGERFSGEIRTLKEGRQLPPSNQIASLAPYLDSDGILRVGGRLIKGKDRLRDIDVNPIIIPKISHIAFLLVKHHHNSIYHQGRRFTEGRLRSAGLWIIGVKRLVSSVIHRCVSCRRLRGTFCSPKMADLPADRLSPGPPFSFVGVDTFGPWNIVVPKTRGHKVNRKRWAIMFTCLVSRAVHIEVVEEMSSSSFINALRRFISMRGPVRQFRSDRGTNFIGAVNELGIPAVLIENQDTQSFLAENRTTWIFNPPHASHFGGVWERMIGVSRRILDGMLLRSSGKDLTHETLSTFLAEVCAIVNSRPLASVSEDPSDPCVLSPNMLLTQKLGYLPDDLPTVTTKDMYKAQWRHVQVLAKEFWKKWQREYLSQLQPRQKWTVDKPDLSVGDIVLLKDSDTCRYLWPKAIVTRTFPSDDNHVRKVEIRVSKDGKQANFVRPVSELVPLIP